VTTFCVGSLPALSQNPTDTTNTLLLAISLQLANSSSPVASDNSFDFSPARHDVYVNVLYFLSLTLSLSASTFCILSKKWIREYQKDLNLPARDTVRVRQLRFESLMSSRIPKIIEDLPILLLIALSFFFTGLLIQLWHTSDITTAISVSFVVFFTESLILFTTVSPTIIDTSGYFTPPLSSQSWLLLQSWRDSIATMPVSLAGLHSLLLSHISELKALRHGWTAFDLSFLEYEGTESDRSFRAEAERSGTSIHRALKWTIQRLHHSSDVETAALVCLQPLHHPRDLVTNEGQLGQHVLSLSEDAVVLDLAYYEYSRTHQSPGEDMQRGQVELLVRSMHQAFDYHDWTKVAKIISHCVRKLRYDHQIYHGVWSSYSTSDASAIQCEYFS